MRVAIIGSRTLQISDLEQYLPPQTTAIISGGAKGIDTCARIYAQQHCTNRILPECEKYGRRAPLVRNDRILEAADFIVIFWYGKSKGTAYMLCQCRKKHIPFTLYVPKNQQQPKLL